MNITFINDTLFPIVLFISFYCFYSNFFNLSRKVPVKETNIDNLLTGVKEAFSQEFDPEPQPQPQPQPQPREEIKPRQILALPSARQRQRRRNTTQSLKNKVIITPVAPTQSLCFELPPIPKNPTIRQLRKFIKEHNLQKIVKQKIGKTVSKCNKGELIKALN